MPQDTPTRSLNDNTIKAFLDLPEDQQSKSLAGMSDEAKQALLSDLHSYSADPQRAAKAATGVRAPTATDKVKSSILKIGEWLPSIGGAVGGFAGGGATPTGMAGAAAGGALGKVGQRLLETGVYGKEPTGQTPGEAATEIGTEAVKQGALEGAGRALGKGAKLLAGEPGEHWAARPINRMLRSTKTATFPGDVGYETVGRVMQKEKLPIATGVAGMRNAVRGRINSLVKQLDSKAAKLDTTGRTVDLLTPIGQSISKATKTLDQFSQQQVIDNLAQLEKDITQQQVPMGFGAMGKGGPPTQSISRGLDHLTASQALKFRRGLDDLVNMPGATPGMKAYLEDIRTAIGKEIHNEFKELAPLDKRVSALIDGEEFLKNRVAHLESGTVERTAGAGPVERFLDRRLPTRTTPGYMAQAKVRNVIQKGAKVAAGGPKRVAAIQQVPRAVAGRSPMTPPPDEDENE